MGNIAEFGVPISLFGDEQHSKECSRSLALSENWNIEVREVGDGNHRS
jgi:hypothetical protein